MKLLSLSVLHDVKDRAATKAAKIENNVILFHFFSADVYFFYLFVEQYLQGFLNPAFSSRFSRTISINKLPNCRKLASVFVKSS